MERPFITNYMFQWELRSIHVDAMPGRRRARQETMVTTLVRERARRVLLLKARPARSVFPGGARCRRRGARSPAPCAAGRPHLTWGREQVRRGGDLLDGGAPRCHNGARSGHRAASDQRAGPGGARAPPAALAHRAGPRALDAPFPAIADSAPGLRAVGRGAPSVRARAGAGGRDPGSLRAARHGPAICRTVAHGPRCRQWPLHRPPRRRAPARRASPGPMKERSQPCSMR